MVVEIILSIPFFLVNCKTTRYTMTSGTNNEHKMIFDPIGILIKMVFMGAKIYSKESYSKCLFGKKITNSVPARGISLRLPVCFRHLKFDPWQQQ